MAICNERVRHQDLPHKAASVTPAVSLRLMLVDDDDARSALVTQALRATGNDVVARLSATEDLLAAVRRIQPDVVLVDMDNPARDVLDTGTAPTRQLPRPLVSFARQSDPDTVAGAVRAGLSAYVVESLGAPRLQPVLEVAIARYAEHRKLRDELEELRTRLADRHDVERAKATLRRLRKLDEAAAYALLRRSAMARRITIGEAARTVLAAAELFDSPDGP